MTLEDVENGVAGASSGNGLRMNLEDANVEVREPLRTPGKEGDGDIEHSDFALVDTEKSAGANEYLHTVDPVSLSWENLEYSVVDKGKKKEKGSKHKPKKKILDGLSGIAKPGEILAIIGPSGCGKTTLLDHLADRIKTGELSGDIYVNGTPRVNLGAKFRRMANYVPQEDSLLGVFTVRETLKHAAGLTVPNELADKRGEIVDQVTEAMGLTTAADTRVGDMFFKGLSGGQKRRLSIAIELIAKPSILILDEPTSGLDSASALGVMEHLCKLADRGHTIIATMHQPSSDILETIDNLLLLSEGKPVYFGSREGILQFLDKEGYPCPKYTNLADFVLGLVNTDFPRHGDVPRLISAYHESSEYYTLRKELEELQKHSDVAGKVEAAEGKETRNQYAVSYLQQFSVLLRRSLINNTRNPGVYWVRMVMYVMLSIMCGTMYLRVYDTIGPQEIAALLFYVAAFMVFMSVAVLPFFIDERAVFLRERANGMFNVGVYVVVNFLAALPGLFAIALTSSVLVVFLVDLNGFWIFLLDLFLSLMVAEGFMFVMSAVVPHYIVGIALAAGVYGMFMLSEGFFVTRDNIPPYWLWSYYIGFHTYSFRTFMYNEFHEDNKEFLALYDMDDVDVAADMFVLLAYAFFFQILFGLILYFFHTGKR